MTDTEWIQAWYARHCDGDWEHDDGIRISTLDNPGWRLSVNLCRTAMAYAPYTTIKTERSETDWMHCWVKDHVFEAAGGPLNLGELLSEFRRWAESVERRGDGPGG